MESPEQLARRLKEGLTALQERGPRKLNPAEAQAVAAAAATLERYLSNMSEETRRLIHTADSGFASSGAWVDSAIDQQDQAVKNLARGTLVMSNWVGPDGLRAEQEFFVRGNIRAWAHRWRTEEKGPAMTDSDPEFMEFAMQCLTLAGISSDLESRISKALRKDWRTA